MQNPYLSRKSTGLEVPPIRIADAYPAPTAALEYLLIGHLSLDRLAHEPPRIGGSVAYAGAAAQLLGCGVAAVSSANPGEIPAERLPDMCWRWVPAERSTRYESRVVSQRRYLRLAGRAAFLTLADVPSAWRRVPVVHLAPIAGEVDPDLVHAFGAALIGLTPQGWLRRWDSAGVVQARFWPRAEEIFPRARAVILSEEDLSSPRDLEAYRRWAHLLVLTRGRRGCIVCCEGICKPFDAPAVNEIDATGAGDIFAATYLVELWRHADPWRAARHANALAAISVTQRGLAAKLAALRNARSALEGPRGAR